MCTASPSPSSRLLAYPAYYTRPPFFARLLALKSLFTFTFFLALTLTLTPTPKTECREAVARGSIRGHHDSASRHCCIHRRADCHGPGHAPAREKGRDSQARGGLPCLAAGVGVGGGEEARGTAGFSFTLCGHGMFSAFKSQLSQFSLPLSLSALFTAFPPPLSL